MGEAVVKKKGISTKEIFAYSFGLFGLQTVIGYMNAYQAQFYNKTMAADLGIIGIIMLVAKLISSFADPYIGSLIDRSNLKGGKLRPWILVSLVPFLILSVVIFVVVPFRGIALYCYIFITFLLWSIAMSFADIPSQGMLAMLSPQPDDRNKIAGIANLLKSIGTATALVIVPVVCILTQSEGGAIGRFEYIVSAIAIGLIGCVLFSLIFFVNRERVPYQSSNVKMKDMFVMLKNNKPLMLLFISAILGFGRGIGTAIQLQVAAVLVGDVNLFGMTLGGENTVVILGVTSAVSSIISMALVPSMTKKWGEKKVFIGMAIYGLAITLLAFIMFVSGVRSLISILIMLFFIGLMYGPHSFLPMVMVADCVDYYELKSGKRTEGAHYAVLSLSIKLSTALAVAGGLIMISLSGYNAGMTEFTTATENVVYFTYVLIPGIGCILAAIPIFFYKLVGANKKKVVLELAERRMKMGLVEGENAIDAVTAASEKSNDNEPNGSDN
ncbi:MAG TPA: MFS transporter [Clostridia bacterium]|nr:MFS transporter [Clostridia bacterium]